jgi:sulfate adenylyltransferase subunit 2
VSSAVLERTETSESPAAEGIPSEAATLDNPAYLDHLDQLENQSVYIFREAYHAFQNICMPWSMGKDSNVLLWLAKKAFCGHIPFPVLHIDTTYEFPEMLEFREWAVKEYGLKLIVKINEEARWGRGVSYETHDPVTVTHELKTVALQQVLAEHKFDALITGIRRDEDSTRAKERYFSPRSARYEWDYRDQPPEFWGQFTTDILPGEHVRVQALLDWSEIDIWRYIQRNNIPIPQMYFARDGKRYRSLGCSPITLPVESNAATIEDIIAELATTRVPERAGRAQDHHERNAMQKLRAKGFM